MIHPDSIPLAAKPLNRAAHRRRDDAWLEDAIRSDNALIFLTRAGLPLLTDSSGLLWMGPEALKVARASPRLFLGEDGAGAPVFALDLPESFRLEGSLLEGAGSFSDLRMALPRMPLTDANCAGTARSLFLWHASHRFCARCGGRNGIVEAGWKAQCTACGAEHFPRTDPVAIMLATHEGRALLGRQRVWPAGFMSCLAGFCEPGETIEQAAAREMREEAGIICDPARAEYVACQPWPFPSSLMIGLIMPAETSEIRVDTSELEAAIWVSREEARAMIEGRHAAYFCPPHSAIAHHILKEWAYRAD